jgi:catechol 2,3-dioxygenase-like lactoylglutathione lyase family enzyme
MLDHIGIFVSDPEKSKAFYQAALSPIGIQLMMSFGDNHGFGSDGKPYFWIGKAETAGRTHVAFVVPNRELVNAFYKAALAAGGKDNGAPGLREIYHPTYYGAFVLDPDGHNVEAVCHKPE